jgi:hypothetical protein
MQFRIAAGEPIGTQLPDKPMGLTPFSMGSNAGWGVNPSPTWAVAAQVTVSTTGTIDASQAGVFQYLLTAGAAFAPSLVNMDVGQVIIVMLKQPATSTAATFATTNMGTFTVAGAVAGGGVVTLSSTNSFIDLLKITCVAPLTYVATLN